MPISNQLPTVPGPIGIFDSGYGGLTILSEIRKLMPDYDYVYLGDNARAPYGTRSFDVVYDFTLEAVKYLFAHGCHLVILACNTASAKALRSIQQKNLPQIDPTRRVLGVIRPTVEIIGSMTKSRHVGILGTPGTINSQSYNMEIAKLFPDIQTIGQACPMWVPLVENREHESDGADYFVQKYINNLLSNNPKTDTLILACTHYPILINKIRKYVPDNINILSQGELVAKSLFYYLQRHPGIDIKCTKNGNCDFLTTENSDKFNELASLFLKSEISAKHINITTTNT